MVSHRDGGLGGVMGGDDDDQSTRKQIRWGEV